MKKIKYALISVSDKKNLSILLSSLSKFKIQIISSGGTYKEIKKLGYNCIDVSKFTGFSEILNGRVKTLHPKIHAGILSVRNKKSHNTDLKKNNFEEIDLVIVNFYPFEKILNKSKSQNQIIENIDVGGPAMVRAAAKNFKDVTVITGTEQYKEFINEIDKHKGKTSYKFREKMSELAFSETAYYDAVITNYLKSKTKNFFPKRKVIYANLIETLRYGENPHQQSAIYSKDKELDIKQISGKKLSYNNYNDIFSALQISKSLPKNIGTVIVKHSNPCGISINKNNLKSYLMALSCDPVSAFGGIVACNFKIKKNLALELKKTFLEVIVCNGIEKNALKILQKKKNLRIIDAKNLKVKKLDELTSRFNSILSQSSDNQVFLNNNFKVVSKRKPSKQILKNLIFAFNVCRFVKSNAIVIANRDTTVGIGSGQPSRLESCEIAIKKMKKFFNHNLENNEIVAASDAFFPFVDGIERLVQSGISAIIQPSGSIRDKEIINFANRTNTILIFSKTRHFKH